MEAKDSGVRPASELCILPIFNFITDIEIKYNKNIVGYIISNKNHLNRQIFCAKNVHCIRKIWVNYNIQYPFLVKIKTLTKKSC